MGDNTGRRNVNDPSVTNVISGPVNHSLVIQTGSFEGDVHVHASPEQSAERDSALEELKQRVAAQERAEEQERQRRAQEQREAEYRKEQERRRRNRNLELDISDQIREERAGRIRLLLGVAFCALGLVLLVAGFTGHHLFLPLFGIFLFFGGVPLARAIPTSALESLSRREINSGPSGRAAPDADRAAEARWMSRRPPH
ncbi:hypothetical protein ACIBK8_23410 [Streptomyces sp. NPDC050161]|uniref:hypothetical protein n=1 Tax=Streptomyces sp. NPDC050161 TaxID=3365604 RepID=UPI0037B0F0D0